jgi:hypothetical protein
MLAAWAIVLGAITLFYSGAARHEMLMWSIGVLTGFAGANAALIRLSLSRWPVYDTVIDWSKVKSLEEEARGRRQSSTMN